jgi:hypothetical protein
MAKRSFVGGRRSRFLRKRCEAVWSLLVLRYSKVSGSLFNRAWDPSAVAYAYRPLPLVWSPTEELMTGRTRSFAPKKSTVGLTRCAGEPMRGGVAMTEGS